MVKAYPDFKHVQRCLQQIEFKLGWGDSSQWHNEVFSELSERIHEETQVLLSPTTLKRVWGRVNYASAPSITTLNALAAYAGAVNWREFKMQASQVGVPGTKIEPKLHMLAPHMGVIIGSAAFMTIMFISLFSMIGSRKDKWTTEDLSKVSFSSRPIVKDLPNSVVFDFELNGIKADSFCIQQYWDPTKTISIQGDQTQATGIYYYPGYYRAKLIADGEIIREHDVFIKSHGWIGTLDYAPVPRYLTEQQVFKDNLSLPSSVLQEVKLSNEIIQTSFHLVEDLTKISADHFSLHTTIKNAFRETWAICQKTQIVILGTTGAMIIPFSIPGCVSDLGLMLNDVYVSGKSNDLSMFGVDFSKGRDIEISIIKKQVRVLVDDVEIYRGSYHEPMGQLAGLRYRFIGAGVLEHMELRDENNQVWKGIGF
jgi:hypothetical protein